MTNSIGIQIKIQIQENETLARQRQHEIRVVQGLMMTYLSFWVHKTPDCFLPHNAWMFEQQLRAHLGTPVMAYTTLNATWPLQETALQSKTEQYTAVTLKEVVLSLIIAITAVCGNTYACYIHSKDPKHLDQYRPPTLAQRSSGAPRICSNPDCEDTGELSRMRGHNDLDWRSYGEKWYCKAYQ